MYAVKPLYNFLNRHALSQRAERLEIAVAAAKIMNVMHAAVFNIQIYLSGAYSLGIKSVMHYSLSLVYYKIILSIFRLRRRAAQAPDRRA